MDSPQARAFRLLRDTVDALKEAKPGDRSEVDRCYAVVITMLEKAVAFFDYYINYAK